MAVFDAFARRFGRPLTIVRVTDGMLPQSLTSAYLPRAIFFKFLMPEIFEGDRFLYLDADLIAQVDLEEIWRDYRDDLAVGGVADIAAREWKRRLGSPEPDVYINTGVLLVNNRRWREERVLARCEEWLANNRKLAVFASQDSLNNALPGGIYLIPGRWNVTRNNQPPDWRLDPDSFRGIMHFAGRAKPWMRWAEPALQDFYLHYARIVGIPAGYWVEARIAREALSRGVLGRAAGQLRQGERHPQTRRRGGARQAQGIEPGGDGRTAVTRVSARQSAVDRLDRDRAHGERGAAAGDVGPDADILRGPDRGRHLVVEAVVVELRARREHHPAARADIAGGIGDGEGRGRPLVGGARRDGQPDAPADEIGGERRLDLQRRPVGGAGRSGLAQRRADPGYRRVGLVLLDEVAGRRGEVAGVAGKDELAPVARAGRPPPPPVIPAMLGRAGDAGDIGEVDPAADIGK